MKKTLLFMICISIILSINAQQAQVKPNLKTESAKNLMMKDYEPVKYTPLVTGQKPNMDYSLKSTDVVSIVSIGTSANAFGYGYAGGQKNLVNYNTETHTITNFHRMGGNLDPGGYSGDLGYDISFDGGITWTNMVECYVATINAGGTYFLDAARYPNHGLYNPAGNTDPNETYVTFFAPNLDASNEPEGFGGYSYGRAKVGDVNDTTKHLKASNPAEGIYQYTPDGFCITNTGHVWVIDDNRDMANTPNATFMGSLIVNHGTWNEDLMDFEYEEILFELEIEPGLTLPAYQDVEFSPDGQYGYIVTLADDGSNDVSAGLSYFPIIWRTDDGGETWSDPIPVPLAGEDGIGAVQDFLSDEELAELFEEPLPDRDEIAFTTAFDCDISVDKVGNPHIAVICGVTGSDAYSIVSDWSTTTGYMFTAAFLLSSMDQGEQGSWIGYELGRPISFRGEFGADFTEDNRIQISRDTEGEKMFVSWLDTDTTVATGNNAPDIWARGVDVINHIITVDANEEPNPVNVTFGSEATFSAYFFAQSNEVISNDGGTYTIPYVYEQMTPTDPGQPVQFKYIQDFTFSDDDFLITGVEEPAKANLQGISISQPYPNPANQITRIKVILEKPAFISGSILDLTGKKVMELPPTKYSEGISTIPLDVSGLTKGIYFITMNTGENNVSQKLIVE